MVKSNVCNSFTHHVAMESFGKTVQAADSRQPEETEWWRGGRGDLVNKSGENIDQSSVLVLSTQTPTQTQALTLNRQNK